MKVAQLFTCLAATQAISAASIPAASIPAADHALITLEGHRVVPASEVVSSDHTLERRKGGGGRGGGGGGGRSSGGGGRSSGGSGGSGGASRGGSGVTRNFGGGQYYGGGARRPYSAGGRTPKGLVAGALIAPAAMLAIMPGLWLYSTYPYYYNNQYRFYNESATNDTENNDNNDNNNNNNNDKRALLPRQSTGSTGANETLPVMCVCMENRMCGCDENDDPAYIDELVGNGSYPALNKTLVTVSDVNGTKTLVLNGTLPEGTTAPDGESGAINLKVGKYAGYYAVGLMVVAGVLA